MAETGMTTREMWLVVMMILTVAVTACAVDCHLDRRVAKLEQQIRVIK
jgi:hypothetical protein